MSNILRKENTERIEEIRYRAKSGETHHIYIPFTVKSRLTENGDIKYIKSPIQITANVHDWMNGLKFESHVCMKKELKITDNMRVESEYSSCPFCNRVVDAYDICYNKINEIEENCMLEGKSRTDFIESKKQEIYISLKISPARKFIYMLVVVFRIDENGNVLENEQHIPEFDLKVMKMNEKREKGLRKLPYQCYKDFEGCEIQIEYENNDSAIMMYKNRKENIVLNADKITKYNNELLDKINDRVERFSWIDALKEFREFDSITEEVAKGTMDSIFFNWDNYKENKLLNEKAVYMD